MPVKSKSRVAAMIVGFLVLSACSGPAATSEPLAIPNRVDVVNIAFMPSTLRVSPNTEVTWTNEDDEVRHTVTSGLPGDGGGPGVSEGKPSRPDRVFDGDLPDATESFSFRFEELGTYAYFCRVHPSMIGEIIVE